MTQPELTIIRGLPGSGKSTLAQALVLGAGFVHYEADMYFLKETIKRMRERWEEF